MKNKVTLFRVIKNYFKCKNCKYIGKCENAFNPQIGSISYNSEEDEESQVIKLCRKDMVKQIRKALFQKEN